jgi:acyl-CoA reductase-like NAD-dependent aldehyde dehydrogenase
MNTTRQQRRSFVLNAKKQWKKGLMSKQEYETIKKQMADLGRQQHAELTKRIQEEQGVTIIARNEDILEEELTDSDFAPEDLDE